MRLIVFAGNNKLFGYSIFGEFFELWLDDYVDDAFTGIQHFFREILWNKHRRFGYAKFEGTGVNTVQVL